MAHKVIHKGKVLHNGFAACYNLDILKEVDAGVDWDDFCDGLEKVFGESIKKTVNEKFANDLEYIEKMQWVNKEFVAKKLLKETHEEHENEKFFFTLAIKVLVRKIKKLNEQLSNKQPGEYFDKQLFKLIQKRSSLNI